MNKSETDFIEQYSRIFLLDWCCQTLTTGSITDIAAAGQTPAQKAMASICMTQAEESGWVGKSTPKKVLAKGFATSAAFLRR